MSDILGPERGVFCILISDLILKSALVLFIVLRARNHHYNNKVSLEVELFKCKSIHRGLLSISVLRSIFRKIHLKHFLLLILSFSLQRFSHCVVFILNCHGTLFFSKILNLFICLFQAKTFCTSQRNP